MEDAEPEVSDEASLDDGTCRQGAVAYGSHHRKDDEREKERYFQ